MASKVVLFVCVENAGRSQMAEGFFRKHAPAGFEPRSAGTQPSGSVNPLAVQAMRESGIDITDQSPKVISDSMMRGAAKVVNMGCMDKESCPAMFLKEVTEWSIPDPKGMTIEGVRRIRDMIEEKVVELCRTLD